MAFGLAAGARPPTCARRGRPPAAGATMMLVLVLVLVLVPLQLVPLQLVPLQLVPLPPWRRGCRGGSAAGATMAARMPR